MQQVRVKREVIRKLRDMAIKQALSEIRDIEDKSNVEYVAKRHGLSYAELKQAYTKAQKND